MGDEPPTPGQVKVARQLLGWSQADVAGHVGLRKWTIGSFELDKPRWPRLDFASLAPALESAGVIFVEENGAGKVLVQREIREHRVAKQQNHP